MSVDGRAIDESRKRLLSLINRMYDVMNNGCDTDTLQNILCDLADYAGYGFLEEEKLMSVSRFPERDEHITEHWAFINSLTVCIADFEKGSLVVSDTLRFLIRWVASHVRKSDVAFGRHLGPGVRRLDERSRVARALVA